MINVFVSSTFNDMHGERDAIQLRVLPEIRKLAENAGEGFDFCDLRWGIDTHDVEEEGRMSKILDVCFGEIVKCKPYMVVLLGERYGSTPAESRLNEVVRCMNAACGSNSFAVSDVAEKSYTDLEIIFGPLRDDEQFKRTLFFFRNHIDGAPASFGGSEDDARKMRELKAIINERKKKLGTDNVKEYTLGWDGDNNKPTGIEEFSDAVAEELCNLLQPVFDSAKKLTDSERRLLRSKLFLRNKAAVATGLEKTVEECERRLGKYRELIIYGSRGSGKSCLAGKLAERVKGRGSNVYVYCCDRENHPSVYDIYEDLCEYLKDKISCSNDCVKEKSLDSDFYKILREYMYTYDNSDNRPLYVFVDGVDKIDRDGNNGYEVPILPNIYSKIFFVYTHMTDLQSTYGDSTTYMHLQSVSLDIKNVLRTHTEVRGRSLPSEIVVKLKQKLSDKNLYFVGLLLKRLSLLNADDFADGTGTENQLAIYGRIADEIPDTIEQFALYLINIVKERTSPKFAEKITDYFAAAGKCGLRRTDIRELIIADGIEWDNRSFETFVDILDNIFIRTDDGRVAIENKELAKLLANEETVAFCRKHILKHIKALPITDEYRKSNLLDFCMLCDDKVGFVVALQNEYFYSETFVRSFDNFDKTNWFLNVLDCGEACGADERIVQFIVETIPQYAKLPTGVLCDIYGHAAKLCERICCSERLKAMVHELLSRYAPGSEYNALTEGRIALDIFKANENNLDSFGLIRMGCAYDNRVYQLRVRRLYDETLTVLDEFYGFIERHTTRFASMRKAYFLYLYAKEYENVFNELYRAHENYDDCAIYEKKYFEAEYRCCLIYEECLKLFCEDFYFGEYEKQMADILLKLHLPDRNLSRSESEERIKRVTAHIDKVVDRCNTNLLSAVAFYYGNCCEFFLQTNQKEQALEYARRTIDVIKIDKSYNDNSYGSLFHMCCAYTVLAQCLYEVDKPKEALETIALAEAKINCMHEYGHRLAIDVEIKAYYEKFRALVKLKRYEESINTANVLMTAIEKTDNDPNLLDLFVDTLAKLSDIAKASLIPIGRMKDYASKINSACSCMCRLYSFTDEGYAMRYLFKDIIKSFVNICKEKNDAKMAKYLRRTYLQHK